jgi:hypothetical protein
LRDSKTIERLAKGLTVLTFMLLCWVGNRATGVRTHCLNSNYLIYARLDGRRIDNCIYESRLNLANLLHPIGYEQSRILRAIEQIDRLDDILPVTRPGIALEILSGDESRRFELSRNHLRLGGAWLSDFVQFKRALVMAVLSSRGSMEFASQFQMEVITDFLLIAIFGEDQWESPEGQFSVLRDVRFPTTAPDFVDYCRSPFRSLAHFEACRRSSPDPFDLHARIWGFRPLLASALYRVFTRQPLALKLKALAALRTSVRWPRMSSQRERDVESLRVWFESALKGNLAALGLAGEGFDPLTVKQALRELQVESPTHWELTVDLTRSPGWREILEQLRVRSRFHSDERVLVFTPEGERVLPSGLAVAWSPSDIQSQKHVLVACEWPKPHEAVTVRARRMYASQSCGRLTEEFW